MVLIKNIIYRLFCIFPIHKIISWLQLEDKRRHCYANAEAIGSIFHPESNVDNLQNNPNKIISGSGTNIRGTLLIFSYNGSIKIGNNSFIGKNSNVWSANKIEIGNDVLISHNVNIIDTNSHELDFQKRAKSYLEMTTIGHPISISDVDSSPIKIEDHVWISFNCTILKGVTIGKGAIIAAGSLVTKDVAPFTLVGGNPAKVIKHLTEGEIIS